MAVMRVPKKRPSRAIEPTRLRTIGAELNAYQLVELNKCLRWSEDLNHSNTSELVPHGLRFYVEVIDNAIMDTLHRGNSGINRAWRKLTNEQVVRYYEFTYPKKVTASELGNYDRPLYRTIMKRGLSKRLLKPSRYRLSVRKK